MKRSLIFSALAALASRNVSFGGGEGRGRGFDLDLVNGPRSPRGNVVLPVLFDGGVSNLDRSHPLAGYGDAAPWVWHTYFNDFDSMMGFNADATDSVDWDIHLTEAGAGEAAIALVDGDGGHILLTNDAADNDVIAAQKKGESFRFELRKPLLFGARFKVSDAVQSDFLMGLMITDTTPLDVTDGIFFMKDDGDALLDFYVEKDNTASSALGIHTVVTDTFLTVAFAYDGESKIFYGVNGRALGSLAITNAPDDEDLAVTFAIQNGEAVAKTMTIDYIFASKFMGTTRP